MSMFHENLNLLRIFIHVIFTYYFSTMNLFFYCYIIFRIPIQSIVLIYQYVTHFQEISTLNYLPDAIDSDYNTINVPSFILKPTQNYETYIILHLKTYIKIFSANMCNISYL